MKASEIAASLVAASHITFTGALPISSDDRSIASIQSAQGASTVLTGPNTIGTADTQGTATTTQSLESNNGDEVSADGIEEDQYPPNSVELFELAKLPTSAILELKLGDDIVASVVFDEAKIPGLLQALQEKEKEPLVEAREASSQQTENAAALPQIQDQAQSVDDALAQLIQKIDAMTHQQDVIIDRQDLHEQNERSNRKLMLGSSIALTACCILVLGIIVHEVYTPRIARALSKLKRYTVVWPGHRRSRQEPSRTEASMAMELNDLEGGNRQTPC